MAILEPLNSLSSSSPPPPPPRLLAPAPYRPFLSVKVLAESPDLKTIPSNYSYFTNGNNNKDNSTTTTTTTTAASSEHAHATIPVIDMSLLDSGNTRDQRLKFIQSLRSACEDWGFFMVVNHGVPDALMKKMMEVTQEFFELPEEDKMKFETKHVLDPIRCGTSFNALKDDVSFWRDYLKIFVHPHFHSPTMPINFSEVLAEYTKKIRETAAKLLEGISESLGLEGPELEGYMKKELQLESSLQILTANYYPPCPQPELALGLPPHSDHDLLTLLLQNDVGGLQIQHNGNWIDVHPLPFSFLVNTGDQLEVFSDGRYKSVIHRATVNNEKTRISIAVTNGPSLEATVKPASKLVNVDDDISFPKYAAMKYREYLETQQSNKLDRKSCLDRIRIHTA